ncbi:N-formylglutamate amidohydrolase [Flavobacterium sp.]|jgi:N-formylglutamate deformylase|uniref:N-formylglutamate amidohydrolase n=1 Tax=Flavobacterium sp. TaxID=239 RepID=UPI0037C101D9
MKKLILHIPHSSVNMPFLDGYIQDADKINNELIKLTDWYTDELFYSESDSMIIPPFSRMFCDVERFENDEDEIMSKVGMGVLYESCDDGSLLRKVSPALRSRIIRDYYWKHHNALLEEVDKQLKNDGSCLIIDCHSYPSKPLIRDLDQTAARPDFNIGTDKYHTPQKLIDASIAYFEQKGYSIGVDWPYKGTIVPLAHYQKNKKVNSIMLEVNRELYLNEPSNTKSDRFNEIKEIVKSYLEWIR